MNKNFEDNEYLAKTFKVTQTMSNENEEGDKGKWASYTWVCTQEDKMCVDDMLRLKTTLSRLNVRLTPGEHNVPWPICLQLKYSSETFKNTQKNASAVTLQTRMEPTAALTRAFQQEFGDRASDTPYTANTAAVATGDNQREAGHEHQDDKFKGEVQLATKNISRAHGEWDRHVRVWGGIINRPRACARTNNTEVHKELEEIIAVGKTIDAVLVDHERVHRGGGEFSVDMLDDVKKNCIEISEKIKEGQQRSRMLLSWIEPAKEPAKKNK